VLKERREEAFMKKRERGRAAVNKAERDESIWNANQEKIKRAEAREKKERMDLEILEENTQDSEEDLSEDLSEEESE
jgi:hypothetical protein